MANRSDYMKAFKKHTNTSPSESKDSQNESKKQGNLKMTRIARPIEQPEESTGAMRRRRIEKVNNSSSGRSHGGRSGSF